MDYGIIKYLEDTQKAFNANLVWGRPIWIFKLLGGDLTIAENKNEARVFIFVHLIWINARAAISNSVFTFTPSGEQMQVFEVAAGGTSMDGIFPLNWLVRGTTFNINCTNNSVNWGVQYQVITLDQPHKPHKYQ